MNEKKHVKFQGRLIIVGFGSVGQGTLPLLLRHIDMPLERIRIVTGDTRGVEGDAAAGVSGRGALAATHRTTTPRAVSTRPPCVSRSQYMPVGTRAPSLRCSVYRPAA